MKRSDLISLPVISIDNGESLGKVTEIILDSERKTVTGLKFGGDKLFYGKNQAAQIENVQTIGAYAVTVPNQSVIVDRDSLDPGGETRNISPIQKKVISDRGDFLGVCRDYYFNFPGGEITKLILESKTHHMSKDSIPAEQIITLGKDYVIISYYEYSGIPHHKIEPYAELQHIQQPKPLADELVNKVAAQTVQDGHGGVIIYEGEMITPEVVDLAAHHNVLKTLAFVASDPSTDKQNQFSRAAQNRYRYHFKGDENATPYPQNQVWQHKLKQLLETAGVEIEDKLRKFLLNKTPAYTVMSQNGSIIKEKGTPIEMKDLESITDRNDLLRLATSITASEIDEFVSTIEHRFQSLLQKNN